MLRRPVSRYDTLSVLTLPVSSIIALVSLFFPPLPLLFPTKKVGKGRKVDLIPFALSCPSTRQLIT